MRRPNGTTEIFLSSGQIRCIAHFVMFVCRPNGTTGIFPVCGSVTVLHTLLRCTFGRGVLSLRLVVHVVKMYVLLYTCLEGTWVLDGIDVSVA